MAMKDYANKKRRKVGSRGYDKYDDSDRTLAKIVKANRGRKNRSNILFNPMFFMVALVGFVFVATSLYLENIRDLATDLLADFKSESHQKVARKNPVKPVQVAEKKVPKFEFYHTLPKMAVANQAGRESVQISNKPMTEIARSESIPSTQSTQVTISPKDEGKQTVEPGKGYFVQIASFKTMKDAETLKAKLTLSGFDVIIQTIKLPSGETWHRVKSSKVNNIELALNLHSQLKVHQIESIILTDNG